MAADKPPSRADQLRAMREANAEREEQRQRDEDKATKKRKVKKAVKRRTPGNG